MADGWPGVWKEGRKRNEEEEKEEEEAPTVGDGTMWRLWGEMGSYVIACNYVIRLTIIA